MGWYKLAVPHGHPQFAVPQRCDCSGSLREEGPRLRRARLLKELEDELGPRLAGATFETFDLDRPLQPTRWGDQQFDEERQRKSLRQAWNRARAFADRPVGCLGLLGPVGAGKSHLLAAIANALMAREIDTAYASVPGLIGYLRDAVAEHRVGERIRALQQVSVLLMDDWGVEVRDPRVDEWLWRIVDYRVGHELPMAFSTNGTLQQFEERVADRLNGEMRPCWLVASSYRPVLKSQRAREWQRMEAEHAYS